MKKHILPILAGLWPYLLFAVFLYIRLAHTEPPAPVSLIPVICVGCILLFAPVLFLICLLWGVKAQTPSTALLAKWNLTVKLAHIPYYLAIFFLFLVLPVFAAFFFIFDVMALVAGNGFGIAAILRLRREEMLSARETVLHVISHCFFVSDVISAFLIYRKSKNS